MIHRENCFFTAQQISMRKHYPVAIYSSHGNHQGDITPPTLQLVYPYQNDGSTKGANKNHQIPSSNQTWQWTINHLWMFSSH